VINIQIAIIAAKNINQIEYLLVKKILKIFSLSYKTFKWKRGNT